MLHFIKNLRLRVIIHAQRQYQTLYVLIFEHFKNLLNYWQKEKKLDNQKANFIPQVYLLCKTRYNETRGIHKKNKYLDYNF